MTIRREFWPRGLGAALSGRRVVTPDQLSELRP